MDRNIHVLLKYRQSIIYLDDEKYDTDKHIIISTINIPSAYQQKGIFRDFLVAIEAIAKEFNKYVVVENIHNINLKNSLMKQGYAISNEIGSPSVTLYRKFNSDGRRKRLTKSKRKRKSRKQKSRRRRRRSPK